MAKRRRSSGFGYPSDVHADGAQNNLAKARTALAYADVSSCRQTFNNLKHVNQLAAKALTHAYAAPEGAARKKLINDVQGFMDELGALRRKERHFKDRCLKS